MGNFKAKPPGTKERWAGGFVRWDSRGVPTYWIARRYAKRRWGFSLHCHTEDAALKHLRAWEADPFAFRIGGQDEHSPVLLDADLVKDFLWWSKDEKHNSEEWVTKQRLLLEWWQAQLGPKADLKRLSLVDQILPALELPGHKAHRIAVLKTVYSWLRKVTHAITPADDPTLGTLSAPQTRPEQWKTPKAFTVEQYEAVRAALENPVFVAAVDVQAGTGWHCTETVRFAKEGKVDGRILICPRSKAGAPLRSQVSARVAKAAKALRKAGNLDYWLYRQAIVKANRAAGLKKGTVSPGRFRHSVATMAVEAGEDPAAVSLAFGHSSESTLKRFYSTLATPPRIKTMR